MEYLKKRSFQIVFRNIKIDYRPPTKTAHDNYRSNMLHYYKTIKYHATRSWNRKDGRNYDLHFARQNIREIETPKGHYTADYINKKYSIPTRGQHVKIVFLGAKDYLQRHRNHYKQHLLVMEYKNRPNRILEQLIEKYSYFAQIPTPTTREKYFGIELECLSRLDRQQLRLKFYLEHKDWIDTVSIGTDGSLRTQENFCHKLELRILTTLKTYNRVQQIINFIKPDAIVNRSTSTHIHIDQRNKELGQLDATFTNLVNIQPIIKKLVPIHRRDNFYCEEHNKPFDIDGNHANHYDGISYAPYNTYRTFEVRYHEGTLNPIELKNWLRLLNVIDNKKDVIFSRKITSLETFIKKAKLPKALKKYARQRYIEHATPDATTETETI